MKIPRIALFSDSYHETTGVARTALAIEAGAKRRNIPLLSVHAGPETRLVRDGSLVRLDLKRSRAFSFRLERDVRFDLSLWRHLACATQVVKWFAPDVLHFTGPNDVGQLAACVGRRLNIPMVGSWHTNVHEHASRRLRWRRAGDAQGNTDKWIEQQALRLLMLFYKIPHVLVAPDRDTAELLESRTGRPAFVMSRGVNTDLFRPARRRGANAIINVGYVGPLTTEANVRLLRTVESELDAEGLDVRFTIIGEGSECAWLRRHMLRAEFPGVLRVDALADAYAQMDIFALPSEADTAGTVMLEAMASGVPAVVMAARAEDSIVAAGQTAFVADGAAAFVQGVRTLVRDPRRREMMGHAARARAAVVLSWDRMFVDFSRAYDAAISRVEPGSHELLPQKLPAL